MHVILPYLSESLVALVHLIGVAADSIDTVDISSWTVDDVVSIRTKQTHHSIVTDP